ncbi:hypothetical protein MMC30_003099 [Trapelia coarctata]|nr:hypothetical protein [Trapelia coarctata]
MFEDLAVEFWPMLKTKGLTGSMRRARSSISDANEKVDDDQDHSALHFDGENFEGGQYVLTGDLPSNMTAAFPKAQLGDEAVNLLDKINNHLKAGNASAARTALGRALHTLQDFYAHTSWIEAGNTEPHPGIGVRGAKITYAQPTDYPCAECAGTLSDGCPCDTIISDTQLSSGYYFGEDRAGFGGKCHHGGYFDQPHGDFWPHSVYYLGLWAFGLGDASNGINKDSLDCDWSPHGPEHHETAVKVSIDASKKFVRALRTDYLTERQLKLLFGVGPSLAFVIDTTGSMGDIISSVRQQAIKIVDDRVGSFDDEPILYVLVPYNDPSLGAITTTSDPDAFKTAISSLGAAGGGDCPEPSMQALLAALNSVDSGAALLLFTDASAKDSASSGAVVQAAVKKNVAVYPFVFTSPCSGDPTYGSIADGTTGHYFPLVRSDVGKVSGLLTALLRADIVQMLYILDVVAAGGLGARDLNRRAGTSYTIPVNSDMTQVTFIASGSVTLTVTRPDGSLVTPADSGVAAVVFASGSFLTVTAPAIGDWTASVSGSGKFSLSVSGVSKIQFTSFKVVKIGGRPGYEGYFPINGPPASGETNAALAFIDGDFGSANFTVRSQTGKVLASVDLTAGSGKFGAPPVNSFFGAFTLPGGSSLIYVVGEDGKGGKYQRVIPSVITPLAGNGTTNGTTNSTMSVSRSLTYATSIASGFSKTSAGTGLYPLPNITSTVYSSSDASTYRTPVGPTGTRSSNFTGFAPYPLSTGSSKALESGPSEVIGPDTTTIVITAYTTVCPITQTLSSGSVTSTTVSIGISTVTTTATLVIPCHTCLGANYPPQSGAPSAPGSIDVPIAPGKVDASSAVPQVITIIST